MYDLILGHIDSEVKQLREQITQLQHVRALLTDSKRAPKADNVVSIRRGSRTMSAAARLLISKAQKKRWAKYYRAQRRAS